MVLHFPVGLFVAVAAFECVQIVRGRGARPAPALFVWMAAVTAVLSAISGYLLSQARPEGDATLDWHRNLGIAVALTGPLAAWFHLRSRGGDMACATRAYRFLLIVTLAMLFPAGHLGAELTHGEGFLLEPLSGTPSGPVESLPGSAPAESAPQASGPMTFATAIAPIIESKCHECHGEDKQKGKLQLSTVEGIRAGGKSGSLLVAGKPAESLLFQRISSPLESKGHMPPKAKPQPAAAEVAIFEAWIAAGAPLDDSTRFEFHDAKAEQNPQAPARSSAAGPAADGAESTRRSDPAADVAATRAIEALRRHFVHAQAIAADSPLLWIDFAAVAKRMQEKEIMELLAPLADRVAELSLARSFAGDEVAAAAAHMPALRRLDLRASAVTDRGVEALHSARKLEELVLAQSKVTDAAVESIAAIPSLKRLYLWGAAVTPAGVEKLKKLRPELKTDAGDPREAEIQETEDPIKLTNEAPVPGAERAPAAAPLAAVNATCPVTGQPVNPKYQVLFEGKVVGFCCPNCPSKFWAHPAEFKEKIK
jgi:uncharacterized membrane protein